MKFIGVRKNEQRSAAVVEDPAAACRHAGVLRLVLRTQPRSYSFQSRCSFVIGITVNQCAVETSGAATTSGGSFCGKKSVAWPGTLYS
jgi:hypothetical protein